MKTIALALLIALTASGLLAGSEIRTIKGTVTDDIGSALPGVSISVKGKNKGTSTDINGKYSINISENDRVLVFRFIGMETAEEVIGKRKVIDVRMTSLKIAMEEVVVTGYADNRPLSGISIRGSREKKAMYDMASVAYQQPDYSGQQFNTEGYSTIHENGYKSVMNNPLSTFSIDVDRASYANVRRFINQGVKPPVDAVRIEEMINYFNYDYPEPDAEHPFAVYTEVATCPWNEEHYLMHIGLKGLEMDKEELPPSNLVFLLDVSGSMNSPNKLPLLKSAFTMLVNELRPQDRVAIVVYAGAAGLVLESTPGIQKEKILAAIERLSAGGSTAGGAGLQLAYKVAMENFAEEGNNRIILATDGDFNIGASSNAEMERLIEEKRKQGVFMTVLGFGMGNYKDDKMEIIADKGNGNYAYIDNIQEARKVLVGEFGGTLFTIAKDVKFQVEFNPAQIKSYRLIGYENRLLNDEDFNDDKKDAGEMGAGHTVTAIYELVPVNADTGVPSIDPLKYQPEKNVTGMKSTSDELMTIKLRYKKPDGEKSTLMEIPFAGRVKRFDRASANLRFSAAVAGFGMILRDSENKGSFTIEDVLDLAQSSKGEDEEGYRSEFIRLVKTARDLNFAR
ncbi:MAG: von Willebrand factor type A domain-containing protein [Marinilabiliaceae bacterium]|nr:von Willebrand factor type A domain-containing protein [Marinilabiliaceae bacterium]